MAAAQGVQVTIDGNRVHFDGQRPIMRGDHVLVPLRGVLEEMGANVRWNPDTQTVTARGPGADVRLRIGERLASVNGQAVTLDVPAQIVHGSTMVPLRFVGEAFGNTVEWDAQDETVQITTGGNAAYSYSQGQTQQNDRPQHLHQGDANTGPMTITAGTVLQVTLDDALSSDNSSHGDRFTATVSQTNSPLPSGSKVEGYVEEATPRNQNHPGMLELRFDRLDMPNGDSYPLRGSLIGLDDRSVIRHGARMLARRSDANRAAFAGYGDGSGMIVGLMGHRPLNGTVLGALGAYGVGPVQRHQIHNVTLNPGAEFGVRLSSDLSIKGG